ncbi:GSCFA domain-containing protein [Shinella daejeonensis]|uniref:GSCFA domain-containing protein n=1 Tax=Shinella daejeonensis TaxID=659017 RepID=UPI0020C74EAE|nr:GSCFA domain-containing protein [Shinella daejeonensis]MCP8893381.1 GSCFA domain-containing protein [Shinella daejeonensis]
MAEGRAMHPYQDLDEKHFWATAVAQRTMDGIDRLWEPKFRIRRKTKVATYGSCFAQHIGRALHGRGFHWLITEPGPSGLSKEAAKQFNYGVFSARTGNIYTASLLQQWVDWALGEKTVPEEIWQAGDRFFDPFRPRIEPDGFQSREELVRSREGAIRAFRSSIVDADVFVFTLGLTESWFNRADGYEYPMCPGTVAGTFDAGRHVFLNQQYQFVRSRLVDAIRKMRAANPRLKILLTVSPVPLTATASGNHVLVATTQSKSVLRAVAGSLQDQLRFVDYFPSYEIITAPPFQGKFYEKNQRSVTPEGVNHVMATFFKCLSETFDKDGPAPAEGKSKEASSNDTKVSEEDIVCEEELLDAFSPR